MTITPTPGERLTASFHLTASADLEKRTISGLVVPYGAIGNTSWGPTKVKAGAITPASRVAYLIAHDSDRPVGRMVAHEDTADGLWATFKIAATAAGDDALLEASEGVRDGLSIGMTVDKYEIDAETDVITITAGTWYETSQVTFPAFSEARVEKVAASEPDTPQIPDANPAAETTKEPTVDQTLDASAPVTTPDVPPMRAQVREAFPYRPTVNASFFKDMMHAREDEEAAARFSKATAMLNAAAVSTDVAEVIPEQYRPDLYVGSISVPRVVGDAFGQYQLNGPNPFRLPKFGSRSGLIGAHVEGTNPTDGTLAFDEQLVTPVARSGSYTLSRETVEGSAPALDAIVMNEIRESYAEDTEAYWRTLILAGATAGTVVDISNGATAGVRSRMIDYQVSRKRGANVFLAGLDLFEALANQVDGAGRPMNPEMGATNASGSTSDGVLTVRVSGMSTPLVPVLTGGILAMRTDVALYEDNLRTWRWEEVDGPANIKFSAFNYIAGAVLRASGVIKFATQA